jgi:glycosyltransferase involved in cell wall biosynthesis
MTFGGAVRIFHLLRLASRYHDVTVLSYGTPGDKEKLYGSLEGRVRDINIIPYPLSVEYRRFAQIYSFVSNHSFFHLLAYSEQMQKAIDDLLARNDFDIVQTEFAHMGSLELKTDAHKILDSHNVEYNNFRRMAEKSNMFLRRIHYYSEYKKFYREEHEACRKFNSIFVTSDVDKAMLDNNVPEVPKYVVPNGVDASYFVPSMETPEPHSIVFTGLMSYLPNDDGILYFLERIFPDVLQSIPQAKLYIVGSNPTSELRNHATNNIFISGYVDDVRPYIRRSSVYIVPLRMGGGTRLKILEAMAMKKPIVTTSIGSEGIDIVDGESAIIADDPREFAESVVRVLRDAALGQRIAENGYGIMRIRYEWSVIGGQMELLYEKLAGDHRLYSYAQTKSTSSRPFL